VIDPRDPVALAGDAARVAALALAEDGPRDLTSDLCVPTSLEGAAVIAAREPLVVAGTVHADAVVLAAGLEPIRWTAEGGEAVEAGAILGTLTGQVAAILRAERPLLNLLQRASGIATMTRRAVDRVAETSCTILHTRKTTPGLRSFEVAAVLAGGGGLHRVGLADTVMVKDNHWQALAAGGRTLAEALEEARRAGATQLHVEVESRSQLAEAIAAGATRLLIDNQDPATVAQWVRAARGLRADLELEATGGITLDGLAAYAATGVDFISTGMLTHSVRSVDIGLDAR
jgi:nicotinate-nucleotide pyrophosphorylase (carboxylating)